jgi:hypothetical protein
VSPVRDGYATAAAGRCVICGNEVTGRADRRTCSTKCRQRAWRQAKAAPVVPAAAPRCDTVYACPDCDARYLGVQYCADCSTFCHRIGPGGPCPNCDEPVAVKDIVPADVAVTEPPARRPKSTTNVPGDRPGRP